MEFGDKTHIAVITLSMKNRALDVFLGELTAFTLVGGVSILVGGLIASLAPAFWINAVSGVLFIIFGVLTFLKKNLDEEIEVEKRNSILSAFSLVTLMEHLEAYGDTHRAIQQFRGSLSKDELGNLLITVGEGLKSGRFVISEALPSLKAVVVEPTEPLQVKFLYAWEDGKLEVELEFEWIPTREEDRKEKENIG